MENIRKICYNINICPIHKLFSDSNSVSGRRVLDPISLDGGKYSCIALQWVYEIREESIKLYARLRGGFTSEDPECILIDMLNKQRFK